MKHYTQQNSSCLYTVRTCTGHCVGHTQKVHDTSNHLHAALDHVALLKRDPLGRMKMGVLASAQEDKPKASSSTAAAPTRRNRCMPMLRLQIRSQLGKYFLKTASVGYKCICSKIATCSALPCDVAGP
jgi:hypothetical protein